MERGRTMQINADMLFGLIQENIVRYLQGKVKIFISQILIINNIL
jgi:hypothetical protein